MQIFTITLNPAFDVHYELAEFCPGKEQYANRMVREAGGKGINTARALTVNGVENIAYVVFGKEGAADFEARLQRDRMQYRALYVPGVIRENLTIHPEHQPETRISLNTIELQPDILDQLAQQLLGEAEPGDAVSFAGRLPKGLSVQQVCAFLSRLTEAGLRLILDSNSFSPEQLKQIRPWLIKPNEYELTALCDASTDPVECARSLVQAGVAEQVLVSLGEKGSVFCDSGQTVRVVVPKLDHPVSTIGAGDSSVAGFLAAAKNGGSSVECARLAAAWGTAACMTEGTRPPQPEDIVETLRETSIEFA